MADVVWLLVALGFFAVAAGYVRLCEWITSDAGEERGR